MKPGDLVRVVSRNQVHSGKLVFIVNLCGEFNRPEYADSEYEWFDVILADETNIRSISNFWLEPVFAQ